MNSSFPRRSLDARLVPQPGTEGWEEGDGMAKLSILKPRTEHHPVSGGFERLHVSRTV